MTVLEMFRVLAAEFAEVADSVVETWIKLTEPLISKRIFGKLYEQALALLTAHRMSLAGYGSGSVLSGGSSGGGIGSFGDAMRISSYSEGETSVSFSANQNTNLMTDAELALTPYGLSFLSLRRLVVIPIRSAGEGRG